MRLSKPFRLLALAVAALGLVCSAPRAQDYPTKPVKWVVPYPPGGSTDLLARLIGQYLSEHLGQQFVIDNRPGAGNNIGTEVVVNAPPDGYTLLLANPANGINATLYKRLPFNFLRDIAPVAGITRVPNVMEVNPNFPAKTVAEFIAYGKANPDKINMASSGNGTSVHLSGELLMAMTGIRMTHVPYRGAAPALTDLIAGTVDVMFDNMPSSGNGTSVHLSGELFMAMTGISMTHVPYRGAAPALTDLIAGTVDVMFDNMPSSIEFIRSGKLRALAVTTELRNEALPDVPVVADTVPGYEASAWFGIGAPKRTPAAIVEKINKSVNEALADPKMKARLAQLGGVPMGGTPAEFAQVMASETEKWQKAVRFSGASIE